MCILLKTHLSPSLSICQMDAKFKCAQLRLTLFLNCARLSWSFSWMIGRSSARRFLNLLAVAKRKQTHSCILDGWRSVDWLAPHNLAQKSRLSRQAIEKNGIDSVWQFAAIICPYFWVPLKDSQANPSLSGIEAQVDVLNQEARLKTCFNISITRDYTFKTLQKKTFTWQVQNRTQGQCKACIFLNSPSFGSFWILLAFFGPCVAVASWSASRDPSHRCWSGQRCQMPFW